MEQKWEEKTRAFGFCEILRWILDEYSMNTDSRVRDRARIHSHTCSHYTIALRFTSFEIFPSDVAFGKWCRFALIYSCRIRSLSSVCSNKQSKNHLLTIRVNLHVYIFIIKPFELVTLLATTRKWMEISQYHTNNINVFTSRTKTTKELSQDFK